MDDEKIIEMLFLRSEESISAIDLKYGAVCRKIAKNILGNEQDAEECVNDAYLGIWKTVPPEKPRPFSSLLYRIVRNLAISKLSANTAQKRNAVFEELFAELEDYLPSAETVESSIEEKELAAVIEDFLDTLTAENRKVFILRYWYSQSYEDIGRDMGMSKSNVSMRLLRTKEKMRKYLEERGVEI